MAIGAVMNNIQISKSEFKAKALEYFRQIESSGTSLIVTNHGKPSIEIRPYHGVERSPLQVLDGSFLEYANPMEPVGEDDWEALS